MLQLVALLQSWADQAQLNMTITVEMAYAFIALCSALGISGFTGVFYLLKPKAQPKLPEVSEAKKEIVTEVEVKEVEVVQEAPKPEPTPAPAPEKSWKERLTKGLSSSRNSVWGRIGSLFGNGGLDEDALEEVEELLYGADLGPKATSELIESLEEKAKSADFNEAQFKIYIKEFLKNKMADVQSRNEGDLFEFSGNNTGMPKVIMIVGVNGAGKTTTIGKLATKLTQQGAKVVVGACDTFRAAAVDQLQVWCERAGATMIRAKEGANPSGVGYDALQTAINEKADYCILDTAGRLHTAGNLMEELSKSKAVLKKLMEDAPHHTLLVIDAITGQNAIRQAEEFHKALELTGLVFTKCDGSSKAGSAISIVDSLQIPITYIGVGENVEDLSVFNLDEYLDALVGN
ncbi:signal recognition particle-docking protein FtsY [Halobacteriovorax sp. ZH4_bin.1]|uniref:signal recognition particle-docking protein FtsY n=1 Tax=unclassified Halobacteriovorax TaxID=2639665 RepID=UPI00371C7597